MQKEKTNEAEINIEVRDSGVKRVTVIADNADEQARAHKLLARISAQMVALDEALRQTPKMKRATPIPIVVCNVAELDSLGKWERVLIEEIAAHHSPRPLSFTDALAAFRRAYADFCIYVAARMVSQPVTQEEISGLDADSHRLLEETIKMTEILTAAEKHGVVVTHAPVALLS